MSVVKLSIIVTEHAYERSKERLGWSRKATDRMALKAYVAGKKHAHLPAKLKQYVAGLYQQKGTANNIRIHGEVIFLFAGKKLVTVYQLPNQYKAINKK